MQSRDLRAWHGVSASSFAELAKNTARRFTYSMRMRSSHASGSYVLPRLPRQGLLRRQGKSEPRAPARSTRSGRWFGHFIAGELDQALLAGYKRCAEFRRACEDDRRDHRRRQTKGVGAISVESARELVACAEIAKRYSTVANVLLRINPMLQNRSFGMKMAGKPIQFGIDEENLKGGIYQHSRARRAALALSRHSRVRRQPRLRSRWLGRGRDKHVAHRPEEIESSSGLLCHKINLGRRLRRRPRRARTRVRRRRIRAEACAAHSANSCELGAAGSGNRARPLSDGGRGYMSRESSTKSRREDGCFMRPTGAALHLLGRAGTFGAALRSNFVLDNCAPECAARALQYRGAFLQSDGSARRRRRASCATNGRLDRSAEIGKLWPFRKPAPVLGRKTPAGLVMRNGAIVLGIKVRTILDLIELRRAYVSRGCYQS